MKESSAKDPFSNKGKFDANNDNSLDILKPESLKMASTLPRLTLNKGPDRRTLKNSFSDTIKVSNRLTTTLKIALEKLDLIPEYEDNINDNKFSYTNQDLFKSMKSYGNSVVDIKEKDKENNLDEINKFNYSILNNQTWGKEIIHSKSKSNDMHLTKYPVKPNMKILEKELGILALTL